MESVIPLVHAALMATSGKEKAAMLGEIRLLCDRGKASFTHQTNAEVIPLPGMPRNLRLVNPRDLPRRGLGHDEGKAIFLHAIAHIEYNAINLALDAIYRFDRLPQAYYLDWLQVAEEEADHHQRILSRLFELGYQYGDFPAHNGLWDIAQRTSGDLVSRMAMVPCVFEARGLDVTPPMIEKLQNAGDHASANVLLFILEEELGHVEIGVKWYRYACELKQIEPVETFIALLGKYLPKKRQGPFNVPYRLRAGFTHEWLSKLEEASG